MGLQSELHLKDRFLSHLAECRVVLLRYLKNPVQEIGDLPSWTWPKILVTQILITALCGVFRALISGDGFLGIIGGAILNPILIIMTSLVSAIFFYYCFQIFANKTVEFRKLYELIFFANIPFYILIIPVELFPFIFLAAFAMTALLLFKGFIQHFQLERKLVTKLIGSLFLLLLSMWVWQRFENLRSEQAYDSKIRAPEIKLGE
jgi:hypothetical protein